MLSDLRYVLRSLSRAKGFTAVVVLTLGLGIGAAAAIFGFVDWVLFQKHTGSSDVFIGGIQMPGGQSGPWLMGPEAETFRQLSSAFSESATAIDHTANVVVDHEPVDTHSLDVSANLLPMFGGVPSLGRGFLPEEAASRADVAIINYWFWEKQYHKAADVLGRKITIGDHMCTIVGVLPPDAQIPMFFQASVYRPGVAHVDPAKPWDWIYTAFRLHQGVTPEIAQQQMRAAKIAWPASMGNGPKDRQPVLFTVEEMATKFMNRTTHWLLVYAVAFLYAIACINTTNLLLVRALGRKRELSIRLALGGTRRQLLRLLMLEAFVVSLLAGVLGMLLANWLMPVFTMTAGWDNGEAPKLIHWWINWRIAAVLAGLSAISSFVTALVPALRVGRAGLTEGLKEGGATLGMSPRLAQVRGGLVLLQAAFAVVLLTGAGLMVKSIRGLEAIPVGFQADELVKIQFFLEKGYEPPNAERLAMLKSLQESLRRIPGVADVTFSNDILLQGYDTAWNPIELPGGKTLKVSMDNIADNFLTTAGLTLKRGRMVNEGDKAAVVINEALARAAFGEQDPIGQFLKPQQMKKGENGLLVVGIVSDTRDQLRGAPSFHVYQPAAIGPFGISALYVRTRGVPNKATIGKFNHAIYTQNPRVVVSRVTTITEQRKMLSWSERLLQSVLSVLSGMALVLTVVGLFSVLAYSVDCRMSEFGVRMALGASREQIMHLVLRGGVILAVVGTAVGVAAAIGLSHFLQSLLYETPPYDPLVLGTVAVLLISVSAAAGIWPALRATKADVSRLLRSE